MTIRQAPAPAPKPPILCANSACDTAIPRGQEHSFIITYATRGADGRLGSFQCPDAQEIFAGNLDAQHFCCSPQCAAIVAHACIDEHLIPQHHAEVAALAQTDTALQAEQVAMEAHRVALATASEPTPSAQVADMPTMVITTIPSDPTPPQEATHAQNQASDLSDPSDGGATPDEPTGSGDGGAVPVADSTPSGTGDAD